jgi:hypothetical protein
MKILGSPEGVEWMGGADFDEAVLRHVDGELRGAVSAADPHDRNDAVALHRLRQECVLAKEALSFDEETTIPVFLANAPQSVRLTRVQFEEMIIPAVESTMEALHRALKSADVRPADLSAVLLAGGSSRIPLVGRMVEAAMGRPTVVDAHPKHVVALGAARIAAELLDPRAEARATDLTGGAVEPAVVPAGDAGDESHQTTPPADGARLRMGAHERPGPNRRVPAAWHRRAARPAVLAAGAVGVLSVVILIVIVSMVRAGGPPATPGTPPRASAPAEGPPETGLTPVVYRDGDGGLHALWPRPTGPWRSTDITADAGTPAATGSPFLYRTDSGGVQTLRVVYRGTDDHLHELRMTPAGRWEHTDLSAQAHQAQASGAVSPAAGNPFAYFINQGGIQVSIIYRGADDHIHGIRLQSGRWFGVDLSTAGGAPPAAGDPFGYTTTEGGIESFRMVYRGTDDRLHELRTTPTGPPRPPVFRPRWEHTDLSAHARNPVPAAVGDPVGFPTHEHADPTPRVVYRTADGRLLEMRFVDGRWIGVDLSAAGGAPPAAGDPFAYTTTDGARQTFRIVYRGADSHIQELRRTIGGPWQTTDLSAQARAPTAVGDPNAYTTTAGGITTLHVVYRGVDGRVHELRSSGGSWTHAVISAGNPVPVALARSVIVSR